MYLAHPGIQGNERYGWELNRASSSQGLQFLVILPGVVDCALPVKAKVRNG